MADYKVLIIDYEPRSIRSLIKPLQGAGYKIHVAEDGLAGIKAFHQFKPDLTVIEAMIPRKHGFEVCQELKKTEHGRRTAIMIVTAVYKGRKYRTQALHHYGCDEYLEKPFSDEKLLESAERLLKTSAAAAAPPPAATSSSSLEPSHDAETEIHDRLNELLPDDDRSEQASVATAGVTTPEARVETVIDFDPQRARGRRVEQALDEAVVRETSGVGRSEPIGLGPHAPQMQMRPVVRSEAAAGSEPVAESRPGRRGTLWLSLLVALLIVLVSTVFLVFGPF